MDDSVDCTNNGIKYNVVILKYVCRFPKYKVQAA